MINLGSAAGCEARLCRAVNNLPGLWAVPPVRPLASEMRAKPEPGAQPRSFLLTTTAGQSPASHRAAEPHQVSQKHYRAAEPHQVIQKHYRAAEPHQVSQKHYRAAEPHQVSQKHFRAAEPHQVSQKHFRAKPVKGKKHLNAESVRECDFTAS